MRVQRLPQSGFQLQKQAVFLSQAAGVKRAGGHVIKDSYFYTPVLLKLCLHSLGYTEVGFPFPAPKFLM